ncbi:MAG TPA: hypothetical protein VLA89_16565 [Gemmatimonadales bacterium]|nr:hypothetical protein [Gemmatimonadales bacterium]
MICEECERPDSSGRLGFEGDPPAEADYRITITAPSKAAEWNPPQLLCSSHAQLAAEGYLGYGWAITAELVRELPALFSVSTLDDPGTNTSLTGG